MKRAYRRVRDLRTPQAFEAVRRTDCAVLFYMRACPWCVRMMPAWDAAAREGSMWKVERSVGVDFPVETYPTIARFPEGRLHDGARDEETLARFARGL